MWLQPAHYDMTMYVAMYYVCSYVHSTYKSMHTLALHYITSYIKFYRL